MSDLRNATMSALREARVLVSYLEQAVEKPPTIHLTSVTYATEWSMPKLVELIENLQKEVKFEMVKNMMSPKEKAEKYIRDLGYTGPMVWRGDDKAYLQVIEYFETRKPTLEELLNLLVR